MRRTVMVTTPAVATPVLVDDQAHQVDENACGLHGLEPAAAVTKLRAAINRKQAITVCAACREVAADEVNRQLHARRPA